LRMSDVQQEEARKDLGPRISCGCLTSSKRRPQVGQHSSASASRLLGLGGFQLVSAELQGGEWRLVVQTTATVVGCGSCGVRATPHGRRLVRVRDLPIGGRSVVLWWRKRLWRCRESACQVRTWTERTAAIGPQAVMTQRARA
jgi:zinc-finger of transposase IS204/IS1001/IS1096/IS1165